ncbi:hypothetical protein GYMLUDRAFT_241277 [Collybiopsis luxurians FD-317 M1]|uniref:Uncharacterized protein n=1 Tax=Collybiopsis luxurians FD-317 M1 TaxID=944289 RepID=A0A0D0CM06_9AGAR|nr:hypothetical protein GYMLUDRAFT_241277 [Collybiopsis luxurians FD-317 M1]
MPGRAIALAVFSSYFLIIIALFTIILNNLLPKYAAIGDLSRQKRASLFAFLAAGSFIHTWYYMFRFMEWSFHDHEARIGSYDSSFSDRLSQWLVDTALFEQAWFTVCSSPLRWWLSEQLCSYTVGAWTMFIFFEGKRRNIRYFWAYMLLGQLVAISVATNLFYVAISLSTFRPAKKAMFAGPVLWLSILVSLISVSYTPFTNERSFLPNLLVMHTSAMVPLLFGPYLNGSPTARFSLNYRTLLLLVFLTTAVIHVWNSAVLFSTLDQPFFSAFWNMLFSHPAQSSIGWDVIWTSFSYVVRNTTSKPKSSRLALLPCTVLASVGVVAPALAFLER